MALNQCQFVGNLGKPPVTQQFQNGGMQTKFSIAVTEKWTDKNSGEKREKTEWIDIRANGKLAEISAQFLHKGSKVFVQGKMRTDKFQDKNSGQDRYTTYIELSGPAAILTMLDSKLANQVQQGQPVPQNAYGQQAQAQPAQQNGYNQPTAPQQTGYGRPPQAQPAQHNPAPAMAQGQVPYAGYDPEVGF
jgi:single-strand DNA-binding protein